MATCWAHTVSGYDLISSEHVVMQGGVRYFNFYLIEVGNCF